MKILYAPTLLGFFYLLSQVVLAEKNKITTDDFWVRLVPSISKVSAVYGRIKNNSDRNIDFMNITCGEISKKAEIHLSVRENDQAKMIRQEKLSIEPNSTLELKPGSYHIMLMGLKKPLKEREQVNCQLGFSEQITVQTSARVKRAP